MAQHMDSIKIDELVNDFLTAQSLTILPQGLFGDAVQQFVQKDDKHAMEEFITETMGNQVEHLVKNDGNMDDENAMAEMMEQLKNKFDQNFENGDRTNRKRTNRKPRPDDWDTDTDGAWSDNPASVIRKDLDEDGMEVDGEDDDGDGTPAPRTTAARGRGSRARGRGGRTAAAGTTRKTAAAAKKAPAKAPAKSRKKKAATPSDEEEEEDNEVIMLDDDDDEDVQEGSGLFVSQDTQPPPKRAPARKAAAKQATPAATARQTQLSFTNSQAPAAASGSRSRATGARAAAPKRLQEPVDDEISDDDNAFETPPASMSTRRR